MIQPRLDPQTEENVRSQILNMFTEQYGFTPDETERVTSWMNASGYFESPASIQYHDNFPGGLAYHSLRVMKELDSLVATRGLAVSVRSIVIAGLLHDACKAGCYSVEKKAVKVGVDDRGRNRWEDQEFYVWKEALPLGHGEKSMMIASELFGGLTQLEAMMIRWHMGGYVAKDDYRSLSDAQAWNPAVTAIHIADMMATYMPPETPSANTPEAEA